MRGRAVYLQKGLRERQPRVLDYFILNICAFKPREEILITTNVCSACGRDIGDGPLTGQIIQNPPFASSNTEPEKTPDSGD